MNKRTLLTAWCAVVASASSAQGMSPARHPRDYCFLGAEAKLPSRPFNKSTGACASNMIDICKTPGRGLWRVSLILNVNNAAETKEARAALLTSAAIISKKIVGADQAGLAAAIRKGKNAAWTTSRWRTEGMYDEWSTGLGHDIAVRFTPIDGQKNTQ
ncbi:hypothetical protein HF313_07145 [Massilia atriviolacea]|uniref:DUF3015 domain-containing protein n=1 Tax=Massilia atriviolacea TaxID=2495579 RepID=A0A430HLT2_9BURK|nr:hypothetical protein [Massilia atriviolacea]RSZ58527.1 hypothetical protein EJB06_12860 [Massilia atriviolacea]